MYIVGSSYFQLQCVDSFDNSKGGFSGYSGFPLLLKTNTFNWIPIQSGTHEHVSSAPGVNKLLFFHNWRLQNISRGQCTLLVTIKEGNSYAAERQEKKNEQL